MAPSVYDFTDYKQYLKALFNEPGVEKGSRAKLADFLSISSSQMSQVLNGTIHLTSDQGQKVCEFFGWEEDESHYLQLIILRARTSNRLACEALDRQLALISNAKRDFQTRLKLPSIKSVEPESVERFYSTWFYAAILTLLTIPDFQLGKTSVASISEKLGISELVTEQAIGFLSKAGMIALKDGRWSATEHYFHLKKGHPLLIQHHSNWRMEALRSIQFNRPSDIHYSGVVSVSKEDFENIRKLIEESIQRFTQYFQFSRPEELVGLCIDLFKYD